MSEWRQRTVAENQASNAAADVEMSQYVADRTRVNEDKIKQDDEIIEQFGDYNYGWHDTHGHQYPLIKLQERFRTRR